MGTREYLAEEIVDNGVERDAREMRKRKKERIEGAVGRSQQQNRKRGYSLDGVGELALGVGDLSRARESKSARGNGKNGRKQE